VIRPIPDSHGVGFATMTQMPQYANKYTEVQVGRYFNYHFNAQNWKWPQEEAVKHQPMIIDGFAPNLNKVLHAGHLRNLALAVSIFRFMPDCKPVALLGASQGVISTAMPKLHKWFNFLDYKPELYYDVLQPWDYVKYRPATKDDDKYFEEGKSPEGCQMWDGPKGPIIVIRSDGRPNYSFWDIAFAQNAKPTHYLTGAEQKGHFESLGCSGHLGMGLVLGKDGKKMASRNGDSVAADEILASVQERLKETEHPLKVAWNVLAWNFLHTSREQNVKYDAEGWTDPDAPGMYITYTYARIMSALSARDLSLNGIPIGMGSHEFVKEDIELLGYASYWKYYHQRAIVNIDPAQLANYAHNLAKKLNLAYHREKIVGGRPAFQYAVERAVITLGNVMTQLTMFTLPKV
jgi:arginyl-tRNA synthetase